MFWKKKPEVRPRGVPLDELEALLAPTLLHVSRDGDALVARHEHYTTRVEVGPPDSTWQTSRERIQAIVRVVTEVPPQIARMLTSAPMVAAVNRFSSLGAVTLRDGNAFVGCRLTMYEGEDAWRTLQLPLLMFAVIGGAEGILGGMRVTFLKQPSKPSGPSAWTEDDVCQVEQHLSRIAFCNVSGTRLTAEFGLEHGAVSAMEGHRTALFELDVNANHPELGPGLMCLLQIPSDFEDEADLAEAVARINRLEMTGGDLPPHFGAWCVGKRGNIPAYVTFLPNAGHTIRGVAVNLALWSAVRARWASEALSRLA